MHQSLDCRYFFNSRLHPAPPADLRGEWIDLARDPSAAHELIRLGISPRSDLPVLVAAEAGGKLRLLGLRLAPDEARALADGRWRANGEAGGEGAADGDDAAVRLYASTWCADCRTAARLLDEAGQPYEEVNVDEDPEAETLVLMRSGGRRVVPSLLVDERLWAFHPGPVLLRRLLVPAPAPARPVPA